MKRMLKTLGLLSALAVLNIATVCVFLSAIPARAGLTEPGPPCLQGDINGDGSRTLADALKLLNFLFQEGPEPVACAEGEKVDVAAEMEKALGRFLPRPENIVNLSESLFLLGEDETKVVYEVPDDAYLVLTDVFISSLNAGTGDLVEETEDGTVVKVPAEFVDSSGEKTFESKTGLVFSPGSDVVLRNLDDGFANFEFLAYGYLLDPPVEQ